MKRFFVVLVSMALVGLTACGKIEGIRTTNSDPISDEMTNDLLSEINSDNFDSNSISQIEPDSSPGEGMEMLSQSASSSQNLADLWWEAYQMGTDDEKDYITIPSNESPLQPTKDFASYISDNTFNFKQFMLDQGFSQISGYQVDAFRYDTDDYFVICRLNGGKYGACVIDYYFGDNEKSYSLCITCTYGTMELPDTKEYQTTSDQNLINDYTIDAICKVLIAAKTSTDPIRNILLPTTFYFYNEGEYEHYSENSIAVDYIHFSKMPANTGDDEYVMSVPNWYLQK